VQSAIRPEDTSRPPEMASRLPPECKVQSGIVAERETAPFAGGKIAEPAHPSPVARPMLMTGMLLGAIIGTVLVAMTAYGFWMASKLGVGPRWRGSRREPTSGSPVHPAREQ